MRPDMLNIRKMLIHNATVMWESGRNERGLISRGWKGKVEPVVQLCAQLSGLMLLEMVALLDPDPGILTVESV